MTDELRPARTRMLIRWAKLSQRERLAHRRATSEGRRRAWTELKKPIAKRLAEEVGVPQSTLREWLRLQKIPPMPSDGHFTPGYVAEVEAYKAQVFASRETARARSSAITKLAGLVDVPRFTLNLWIRKGKIPAMMPSNGTFTTDYTDKILAYKSEPNKGWTPERRTQQRINTSNSWKDLSPRKRSRRIRKLAAYRRRPEIRLQVSAWARNEHAKRKSDLARLKNLEGLDLISGLRLSLASHFSLDGLTLYAMRDDVYPDSVDSYAAIKRLFTNHKLRIEAEKGRITKLSDDQRQTEVQSLRSRLQSDIGKNKLP